MKIALIKGEACYVKVLVISFASNLADELGKQTFL